MQKNLDKIGKFEIEISKKYGDEAIRNPNASWTVEKEAEFQEEQRILLEREQEYETQKKRVENEGFGSES